MSRQLLAPFGLKFNPFSPEIPVESCFASGAQESFCWRVEQLAREGGFAMIQGEPGTGKSVTLRLLQTRLTRTAELKVGVLTRPQSSVGDFYRELGDIFGVKLSPSNRWAGTKVLRERWCEHIQGARFRPVLLIDEAQATTSTTLNELRLLCSSELDSRTLLTVVLSGDEQLSERLKIPELLPLASRLRVRLNLESATPSQLEELLTHVLAQAGNPALLTPALRTALCQHAAGNVRVLMLRGDELLHEGVRQQKDQLDERLFFELNDPGKIQTKYEQERREGKPPRTKGARR